ncbi:hypothetical protein C8R47DRAFT_585868 [Mycena vitilis]|nr:hypothetical protein C8R47DRAFT_585868 [Mycena vitilis]
MSARIDTRALIYGLSQLAAHLPKRSQEFGVAPKIEGRTLNHLATCLSRGLKDEQDGEIAVTMGPLNLSGLDIAVVASRTSDDSRDLGTVTQPSSPSHPSSSQIHPLSSNAETPNNESGDRQLVQLTIPAPDDIDNAVLREKFETLVTDRNATEPFITFVHNSLTLLRTAAAYIRREPNFMAVTKSKVCRFFIFSCRPKIRHRVQRFSESYPWDDLKAWQPTSSEISATNPLKVIILHPTVSLALSSNEVPSPDVNLFEFSGSNAVLWWQSLLELVRYFQECLVDPSPQNVVALGVFSSAIHTLLGYIPSEFWSYPSLGKLLQRCREESAAPPAVSSDQPGPGRDDEESVQFLLPPGNLLFMNAMCLD